MPILHMDTELVRGAGRQIVLSSGDIYDAAQRVARAWAALSHDWAGPGRNRFAARIERCIREMRNASEMGDRLGLRTQHEADEWEQVDSNGAAHMAGLGVVPALLAISAVAGGGNLSLAGGFFRAFEANRIYGHAEHLGMLHGLELRGYAGTRVGPMTPEDAWDYILDDPFHRTPLDYVDARFKLYDWQAAGGVAVAQGTLSGALGVVSARALSLEGGVHSSAKISEDGLVVDFGGEAGVYAVRVDYSAELAGVQVAADGYIGANVEAEGTVKFDLSDGDAMLGGHLGGFAGGKLEGEVSTDLGAVDVGARGSLNYGLGASFDGEFGVDDGVFKADFDLGLTAGLGFDLGFTVQLDLIEAAQSVVEVGEAMAGLF